MNDTPDDPHDPKLSRLYCKASQGEPPPALDATIMAAARAATAAQRPPRPWWRRLQAPFALAATVVLAVVLTLSMERNPPSDRDIPAIKSDKAPAPAGEQAMPATGEVSRSPEAADRQKPAASPPASARPPLPAADVTKSAPTQALEAGSADRLGNGQRGAGPAPAAEAKREAAAPPPHRKPDAWIEEIRQLRRQENAGEAERSLREFRAAYPDYPLPEDLR